MVDFDVNSMFERIANPYKCAFKKLLSGEKDSLDSPPYKYLISKTCRFANGDADLLFIVSRNSCLFYFLHGDLVLICLIFSCYSYIFFRLNIQTILLEEA